MRLWHAAGPLLALVSIGCAIAQLVANLRASRKTETPRAKRGVPKNPFPRTTR